MAVFYKKRGYFPRILRFIKNSVRFCFKALALLCSILIRYGRPLLGPRQCKFSLTCTDYALYQLETSHFIPACGRIIYRLLCCNPWYTPTS